MAKQMTLSALNVGAKDLMVMRSLLNLSSGRAFPSQSVHSDGLAVWQISTETDGDVILVDVDDPAGGKLWSQLEDDGRVMVAFTRHRNSKFPLKLTKPLRSRDLLGLLEKLAQPDFGMEQESTDPSADDAQESAVKDSSAALEGVDGPEQALTLADHLRLNSWKKPVVLTHPGWPLILIDPGSGAWFYDGTIADLEPQTFAQTLPLTAGVGISNDELVERVQGHRQRALSELKWFAGLAQMRGRLHPDLDGKCEFMLVQVPPEAMKSEPLHNLARLLIRGPTSFETLCQQSGQAREDICAFLNACYTSNKLLVNHLDEAASF